MKRVICSLLLIVVPAVHAAAYDTNRLIPGMFGTSGYPALRLRTPLTKANLSTPFFKELKDAPNEKKKEILIIAKEVPTGNPSAHIDHDYAWHIKRSNIAATLEIAGADPKWAQNGDNPYFLSQVVSMNDVPLARLMLQMGADIHEKAHVSTRPSSIHCATTKEMAELLVEFGAMKHPHASTVLHLIWHPRYEIALMPYYAMLYIQNEIPFTAHNSQGDTIFTAAATIAAFTSLRYTLFTPDPTPDPTTDMVNKIRSLLAIIPVADGLVLLDTKNKNGNQVFEDIQHYFKVSFVSRTNKLILVSLRNLLRDYFQNSHKLQVVESKQKADCSICLESLNDVDNLVVVQCCKQPFHTACLSLCDVKIKGCPLCRDGAPKEKK